MDWQPIVTAPSGVVSLFCDMDADEIRHLFFVDWVVDGSFCGDSRRKATHWMPLPELPSDR
jgi:hypothetical protein